MAVVWAHCKTKMVCEPDDPKDEGAEAENEEPKKGHGGCGHIQPVIRKEGLKLFVQYKKPKDDDDEGKSLLPDKRPITPSEVYTAFKKMSDSDLVLLGLSDEYARPEWMILTVMPVPPPPVRPSIAMSVDVNRKALQRTSSRNLSSCSSFTSLRTWTMTSLEFLKLFKNRVAP